MDRRHEGPAPGDEDGWPQPQESTPGVDEDRDEEGRDAYGSDDEDWGEDDWGDGQSPIWEPAELEEDDEEPPPDEGDFWIDRDDFAD